MKRALSAFLVAFAPACLAQLALRVSSEQTVGGFVFPESCGYDPARKVLYVGNFGGARLNPAAKDHEGYISRVGLDGKVLEQQFLPALGQKLLHKPKGIWVRGDRLWVTDIDVVWIFDLKTKRGRSLALPNVGFANDPAVMDDALYISDSRNDKLVKIEPADFLNAKNPKIMEVLAGAKIHPNGVYPTKVGMLLFGGWLAADQPKGLYALGVSGQVKPLTDPIGRIDGLYEMPDGSLLFTDWNTGSLSHWSEKTGVKPLASGFKGPADFCVVPGSSGALTVVVPDLVQSQLRFIHLRR